MNSFPILSSSCCETTNLSCTTIESLIRAFYTVKPFRSIFTCNNASCEQALLKSTIQVVLFRIHNVMVLTGFYIDMYRYKF